MSDLALDKQANEMGLQLFASIGFDKVKLSQVADWIGQPEALLVERYEDELGLLFSVLCYHKAYCDAIFFRPRAALVQSWSTLQRVWDYAWYHPGAKLLSSPESIFTHEEGLHHLRQALVNLWGSFFRDCFGLPIQEAVSEFNVALYHCHHELDPQPLFAFFERLNQQGGEGE